MEILPATLHQKAPSPDIPFDEPSISGSLIAIGRSPCAEAPSLAGVNSFRLRWNKRPCHFSAQRGHDCKRHRASSKRVQAIGPSPSCRHTYIRQLFPRRRPQLPWSTVLRINVSLMTSLARQRICVTPAASSHCARQNNRRRFTATIWNALRRAQKSGQSPKGSGAGFRLADHLCFFLATACNGRAWDAWHGTPTPCFREALKEVDGHFPFSGNRTRSSIILFAEDLGSRLRRAIYCLYAASRLADRDRTQPSRNLGGDAAGDCLDTASAKLPPLWCAGALSLEQAIDVVLARSRHQEAILEVAAAMAALMLGEREARRFLKSANVPGVDLAAVNSWRSVTVSGPVEQIDQLLAKASSARISARRLELDYPFHSWLVNPVRMAPDARAQSI